MCCALAGTALPRWPIRFDRRTSASPALLPAPCNASSRWWVNTLQRTFPESRSPLVRGEPVENRIGRSRLGIGPLRFGQFRPPFGGLLRPPPGLVELDDLLAGLGHAAPG